MNNTLSKPVAWKLHHHDRYYFEENADVVAIAESMGQAKGDAVYSQEYVSALTQRITELEAKLAEPVKCLDLAGWQFKSVNGKWLGLLDKLGKNHAVRDGCEVREVYAMTDSPNERHAVREAHSEWSRSTFGNVGPIGPLKHLSKEALEAAAQPDDLSEWADMQFLLWDAQRRAGITDEQITQAMIEKLKVNMARQWPEPKDGEPRLHITAAPAVPDEIDSFADQVIGTKDKIIRLPAPLRVPHEGINVYLNADALIKCIEQQDVMVLLDDI